MTTHDHDPEGHEHHHAHDWKSALLALREAASHYYQHQFNWHGDGPPPGWTGPRYFPPADEWRLQARLDRDFAGTGDTVELATSTGQVRAMVLAGQLVFDVDGAERRLAAYLTHDAGGDEILFVPFRDLTSGSETYGSGRYVEVPYWTDEETFDLDFNFAYNPSCAYSPSYDCPFPPAGNRLSVAVRAGELVPFEKGTT
jgi:uncharacterized protein (DUF1684 family)